MKLALHWGLRAVDGAGAKAGSPAPAPLQSVARTLFFPNQITWGIGSTLAFGRHGKMINSYYHCHGNWKKWLLWGSKVHGRRKAKARFFLLFDSCCLTYKIVLS